MSVYRSKSTAKPAVKLHERLETIESTITKNIHKTEPEPLTLPVPYDVRNQHIYVIGKTRYGKTTLLYSIISQDIENNVGGVCVIDPKPPGEGPNLVEQVLNHIPPNREKDVIYFSAAQPIPIDVMDYETAEEKITISSDLMSTFMQFLNQKDGERWPRILRHVINTLLEAKGYTFLDIYHFLDDIEANRGNPNPPSDSIHQKVLARVKTPYLKSYWASFYRNFPKDAAPPILDRMSTFMLVPPINIMLGSSTAKLNMEDVIREGKILLVDLTGAGKETGNLIGMLLVSRIQQAVFRKLRKPFHLFADEFQNFQTSAFDTILSEAGGLGLRLTLANQYAYQLTEHVRKAVFGTVSTFFVFRIANEDTHYFKEMMPTDILNERLIPHERLASLPRFQALYAISGQVPEIKHIPERPPEPTSDQLGRAQEIRERTLRDYGPDACKTEENPHTVVNAKPKAYPDPAAYPTPKNDASSPSTPRDPLRPKEQGSGNPNPKAPSHEKRPQNNPKKP